MNASRREFIRTGTLVVVGFTLGPSVSGQEPAAGAKPVDPREVDSFLATNADGSVTIYTSKVDVGTGLMVAMCQVVAEELDVPVDRVRVVEGDTALTPDHGGTGGSTGVPRGAVDVRQAAATARQALAAGAARGKPLSLRVDPKAPLKNPASYTIVGKPIPRTDVPAKCTGQHVYAQDHRVPGMVHARIVRPSSIGAKLVAVDEASIEKIPNVRIVRIESFLAVVADDEWAAIRAARELKATWSESAQLPDSDSLERHVRGSAIARDEVIVNRGAPAGPSADVKELSATYWWPCQSHASIGPSCAIADVKDGGTTIWTATQGTHGMRANFSRIFGIPESKLRVIYLDGSGSYGSNGNDDVAADAVLLSKTLGRPVRVQWMRGDEHGWDPKGPPQLLDVRGSVDAQGTIVDWETEMWLPVSVQGGRPLVGLDSAGIQQAHGQNSGNISQNGDPPYAAGSVRVVAHWLKQTPLRPSNLRAPGKIGNVFAVESFTDELAAAAGLDPIEFRLRGLGDPRAIDVIKRAATMIGWQPRPSPNRAANGGARAHGRGFAYARYKQAENYVAMAMEVEVDRSTGRILVRRVTCAHDCGLVINPDGLRNQIEGSIVQTLSRTLHEEVSFDQSKVTSVDWASYPVLRFSEAPIVEVALIDRPSLPPLGAGEASTAPVAAALGNAVFDAIAVRLRSVPFRAERVKAALGRT